MGQDKKLSITEHLLELRSRLIKSAIALGVCIGISIPLAHYVFDILKSRAPGIDLVFIDVAEMLGTYVKVVSISATSMNTRSIPGARDFRKIGRAHV